MTQSSIGNMNPEPLLKAEQILKQYPGTTALKHVDFKVYPGKVNVLIGENGAGKSTLMKILAGVELPTEGQLLLRGEPIQINTPRDARSHGISIIFQELMLFPNLSVSENIFIAREMLSGLGTVQHSRQDDATRMIMKRLEQSIEPRTLVENLRIGQQQLVEIARALAEDVEILIMDEPTSALSDAEATILLRIIRELASQGVAIVYISHKLDECLQIGDYFTVLRDGNLIAEAPANEVTLAWIVENMSGQSSDSLFRRRVRPLGDILLQVSHLSLPREHGKGYLVAELSLHVRAGEIVGIYGLMGAGRTELLECLFGMQPHAMGSINLDGNSIDQYTIEERIRAGLALVPEDRQQLGLVQNLSVSKNISLANLSQFVRGFALSASKENREVERLVKLLDIKTADVRQSITTLSGGNQQKVVLAKNLLTGPKMLMLDEPTRGIDVAAKSEIFKIMNDLAEQGLGVLFVSSELKEVVAMSDRVLVMARGRITGEFTGEVITEQNLADASVQLPPPTHHEYHAI